VESPQRWCSICRETTALDRWRGRGAWGTGRRVAGCSDEAVAGVSGVRGRSVRVVDRRRLVARE
jgi:hypothetical protein